MKIKVSQLLREPIGTERDYNINDSLNIMENGSSSVVCGNFRLTRTNRSILVKGEFSTTIGIDCARCLKSFSYPVKTAFEEEYLPLNYADDDLSPQEGGAFIIDDNYTIDLAEAIRQYALMALPMKPLCSEDCKGLQ